MAEDAAASVEEQVAAAVEEQAAPVAEAAPETMVTDAVVVEQPAEGALKRSREEEEAGDDGEEQRDAKRLAGEQDQANVRSLRQEHKDCD